MVSHPEAIRAGYDETMEIQDINESEWVIQGVTRAEFNQPYSNIPRELGMMRNYP